MSTPDDTAQQLIDLQSQFAFQEDALQALQQALAAQQQEILLLRRQLTLLKQRQDAHADQLDELTDPGVQKPPHY
jgi:SlyX protein